MAAGGAGAPLAALVVGMMPGRLNDGEQDFIDRIRAEQMKEAPTRVRYTWETDEYGDLTPYGWHTPPGNDMVRVRKMEWDGSRQAYTFTTEEDEPVTLIWTPDSSGVNVPSNTGNQTPLHIPSTIIVNPLPDNTQIDAITSPTPEEKTFADYILILPLPNIPPIYVYLNENKTSFVHGHKHHAPKHKSWKEIIESTKSGPAKFRPQTDISAIDHDVWKDGINSTKKQNWKLKEFDEIVGAHGGKETRWVVTKESQGTIHSHPISETDARKLLK
ncbi:MULTISPECIES: S-type pyocin domain-containing protein [Tenebrionibacter/Tenebrionicola group]|uniref:S-type pyocin domain-containing protein n=2 Tax=Tenebrionibacter/Tenebrionicola group TaxID=2969848 RepID=A0A8K0V337_9ENTR|nr:S-type pyocin domain-containing protein [Tenebrionibacter intestinalis]MBV5095198.1 S-type pyocin domain-containing protein [Tenebrionicola larvae]